MPSNSDPALLRIDCLPSSSMTCFKDLLLHLFRFILIVIHDFYDWSYVWSLQWLTLFKINILRKIFCVLPGERLFPPPSGLSYSTWFCVERFSSAPQAHPVRLLTIVRRATTSEQHYVCLAVVLSAKDRSVTVSTKEELLQTYCE